jgi:aspartate/methionine/tyrosine aminotransferase
MTRVAIRADNREKLYRRTTEILSQNLPILEKWVENIPQLTYTPSQAGAFSFLKLVGDLPSIAVAEACLKNQSTLIVPGTHFGMEGYLRVWFGGAQDYIKEGFRRIKAEIDKLF